MTRPKKKRPSPKGEGRRLNTQETLAHFLSGLAPEPTPGRPAGVRLAADVDVPRVAGLLLRQALTGAAVGVIVGRITVVLRAPMTTAEAPRWNAGVRELWWLGVVVRTFRDDAVNLDSVLSAFEKAGWPPRIPDPLRRTGRGNPKQRYWETIRSLNDRLPSGTIRFFADGMGAFAGKPLYDRAWIRPQLHP